MFETETNKGGNKKGEKNKIESILKIEDGKETFINISKKRKGKNDPLKSNYTEKRNEIMDEALNGADGLPTEDLGDMLDKIEKLQLVEIKNHHETIKNFFIVCIKNGQRINQNARDYLYNIDPDLWELIDDITDTITDTLEDSENQKAKQRAKGTLKPKVYFKDPLKTEIYNTYLEAFKEFYKLT